MAFGLKVNGWYDRTIRWLERLANGDIYDSLGKYGEMGVAALEANTPVRTGETAASWDYVIDADANGFKMTWFNTKEVGGESLAVMLQYGHGTGTGGWVEGEDYINPAMDPVFDEILAGVMKEVKL